MNKSQISEVQDFSYIGYGHPVQVKPPINTKDAIVIGDFYFKNGGMLFNMEFSGNLAFAMRYDSNLFVAYTVLLGTGGDDEGGNISPLDTSIPLNRLIGIAYHNAPYTTYSLIDCESGRYIIKDYKNNSTYQMRRYWNISTVTNNQLNLGVSSICNRECINSIALLSKM